MNYDLLNNMIDYIEENLTEDIKYKDLAKNCWCIRILASKEYLCF